MKKPKKVTDAQFKNQVIFTIKGMQANLKKIHKTFPEAGLNTLRTVTSLDATMWMIKKYKGCIVRKPR